MSAALSRPRLHHAGDALLLVEFEADDRGRS